VYLTDFIKQHFYESKTNAENIIMIVILTFPATYFYACPLPQNISFP